MERIGDLLSVGSTWADPAAEAGSSTDTDQELRVTLFNDPPYAHLTQHANGTYSFGGYLYELWQTVAATLDLPYRMVPPTESGYGVQNDNGTWGGMVGELAYGRADVGLSWLYIRPDRAAVIDFIDAVSVTESTTGFYAYGGSTNAPAISVGMFSSLLRPLHAHVWWTLLASLCVLSVALRVTLRFSHRRAERRQTVQQMTWGSCLFSVFRSVVGQGWDTVPDSLAARTVTISTWMLSIIITVSYTANLISHLTVISAEPPIRDLREFFERSDWRLAVSPTYSAISDWKVSKDFYERQLYQSVRQPGGFVSLESTVESLRQTLQPNMLTYTDVEPVLQLLGRDACPLTFLPHFPSKTMGSYITVAKGRGNLRQAINEAMTKIKEAGIVARLHDKWLSTQNLCDAPVAFTSLSFWNLLALMAIMPLGLMACAAAVIIERVRVSWRSNKVRKEQMVAWHPMVPSNKDMMKLI